MILKIGDTVTVGDEGEHRVMAFDFDEGHLILECTASPNHPWIYVGERFRIAAVKTQFVRRHEHKKKQANG